MMTEQQLRSKIAHIHFVVRRLMNTALSGDFSSAFKGGGLEFAQLRGYLPGDDIRSIDWNSSAKMNKLMIKEFVQEKERTILIALDISSSLLCSSQESLKKEYAHNVAAALAMIAQNSNDKVGLLLFSDKIEAYIPPRKGRGHSAHIVRQIFNAGDDRELKRETNMRVASEFLAGLRLQSAIVFMVSDWITVDEGYAQLLPVIGTRFETVAVRVTDPRELILPDVGVLPVIDPETGQSVVIDTRGRAGMQLNELLIKRQHEQKRLLRKHKIDVLDITVGHSFIDAMTSFFHYRVH